MNAFINTLSISFVLSLAAFVTTGCAPVDETEPPSWSLQENEEQNTDDPDIEEPAEAAPQIPEVDYSRDCPDFHTDDPDEFDFELYRYLACRRAPDQSLLFSPALARIALAEAADEAPREEAEQIAALFGFERVADLLHESDLLRQHLLSRRPISGETYTSPGLRQYEVIESDLETLQRALGFEFYSAECNGNHCSWSPQNHRWTDQSFHFNSPNPGIVRNHTRSVLFRGQTTSRQSESIQQIEFDIPDGPTVEYRRGGFVAFYFGQTNTLKVVLRRFVGGQLSLILLQPLEGIPLETIEEDLSPDALVGWLSAIRGSQHRLHWTMPHFDIEETADLSGLTLSHDPVLLTTRLALHREGLNRPEPVELHSESRLATGLEGSSTFRQVTSPILFLLYDHDLDAIILMGRLARPF